MVDFIPDIHTEDVKRILFQHKDKNAVLTFPCAFLMLSEFNFNGDSIADTSIDGDMHWATVPKNHLNATALRLKQWMFEVVGKGHFKDEFVTAGGVPLSEISLSIMESKKQPNLFFAGEVLNVDGSPTDSIFRAVDVLTSDGARVAAINGATDEILVNDIFSGTQARLPKPSLAYSRLILNGGYVFAPATHRTKIQYCSLCYNVKGKAEKNVELLSEHLADWVREEDGKKIVFHTFSNTGWLCYGVIPENLQRQDPSAVEKIKGSVWALGFSAAIMKKNSVATKGAVSNDTRSDVIVVESQNDIRPAATEAVLLSALEKFFDIVLNYPTINNISVFKCDA
ncbi:transmembrane protein 53 [Hordeum vulgare]|nr:transmembrane protein 53 [Hordeum vulgare]